jgi:hypothetical protein
LSVDQLRGNVYKGFAVIFQYSVSVGVQRIHFEGFYLNGSFDESYGSFEVNGSVDTEVYIVVGVVFSSSCSLVGDGFEEEENEKVK